MRRPRRARIWARPRKALADNITPAGRRGADRGVDRSSSRRHGDGVRVGPRPRHFARLMPLLRRLASLQARGLPQERVRGLVESSIVGPTLGIMGEAHVNVLALNRQLDAMSAYIGEVSRRADRDRPSLPGGPSARSRAGGPRPAEGVSRRRARRRQDLRDAYRGRRAQTRRRRRRDRRGRDPRPRRDRGADRRPRDRSRAARSTIRAGRLAEMDIDAILARRPALVAGRRACPHQCRLAAAIRSAGRMSRNCSPPAIDVFSTLNIQHLESLNDVVASFTKVRVRETVPDACSSRPRSRWSTFRPTS